MQWKREQKPLNLLRTLRYRKLEDAVEARYFATHDHRLFFEPSGLSHASFWSRLLLLFLEITCGCRSLGFLRDLQHDLYYHDTYGVSANRPKRLLHRFLREQHSGCRSVEFLRLASSKHNIQMLDMSPYDRRTTYL